MEPIVVRQPLQVKQGEAKDAETMFKARVVRGRIDKRDKTKLADPREAAEVGRVDHLFNAARERNVQLRRNTDQRTTCVERGNFRQVEEGGHAMIITQV